MQDYDELLGDPQSSQRIVADVEVPDFGTARVVTNVIQLSDTPGSGVRRPAPLLGEHTAELIRELGFDDDEIVQVRASAVGAAEQLVAAVYGD